ncbi:two-component system response regulator FixJ [Sphingomonas zeicaulis]|uniref:response regulator transcription factor n=1 Tax=Sphingomonas zeicaulis TaxID=1632740 RepID=UPI003D1A8625
MAEGQIIAVLTTDAAVRLALGAALGEHGYRVHPFIDGGDLVEAFAYLDPVCAILDTRLPAASSIDIGSLVADRPQLPVLALVAAGDMRAAVRAIKSGAIDVVEIPMMDRQLLDILDALVPADTPRHRIASRRSHAETKLAGLTRRERQVASGILAGMTNKAIAHILGIGVRTVETQRAGLFHKLAVRSVSEVVQLALEGGLEPLDLGSPPAATEARVA